LPPEQNPLPAGQNGRERAILLTERGFYALLYTMSDYLDPGNEELLKDFFSEAVMQVETLEQNILVLEEGGFDRDAVDEIFRAAHTLKGGAATVGMTELARFTHLMEDVLDEIRSGKTGTNEELVDALLAGIDIVKAMLEKRMAGEVYAEDTSEAEKRLGSFMSNQKAAEADPAGREKTRGSPGKKTGAEADAGSSGVSGPGTGNLTDADGLLDAGGGLPVYKLSVSFDESALMNTVGGIQVYATLKNKGTILKTEPDFDTLYGDEFFPNVDYYIASDEDPEVLREYVILPDVSLDASIVRIEAEKEPEYDAAAAAGEERESADTEETAGEGPESADAREGADGEAKKAGKEAGAILRVDSKRIDKLMNIVSETVITKAAFNQIAVRLGGVSGKMRAFESKYREQTRSFADNLEYYLDRLKGGASVKEIKKAVADELDGIFGDFEEIRSDFRNNMVKYRSTSQILGRITGELQEGVMRIRMVPINQIFSRFPRIVRDLSKSLNRKINLVIEGGETELDKSVVEDLLDPIMHSVRNSADHGIEDPTERLKAGKSETGTITLKAANEGSMIIIEISDDGRGIDTGAVRERALERGLIHPDRELTGAEAFNLIFEPGFSTAKSVTNISGRGVGLDVVKRQIEKLNGTVTVRSECGLGTTFTIRLPLTLAIIQGLLVRAGSEVYSIPIANVIESIRIRPDEIKTIDGDEVFNIRSEVLSLIRLGRLFGIKTDAGKDYNFVVIVGSAEKKAGLMVDSLIGEEDIVIKPLRDQYTNLPGIAGASILGDGSVSLIIDVNGILEPGPQKEKEARSLRAA